MSPLAPRTIEYIPEEITPVVTEHTIHRDFYPKCKKHVEPVVPDALPNATLGHHVVSLTSWFHYGLGVTIAQVCYYMIDRSRGGPALQKFFMESNSSRRVSMGC